jgi:hypothetical protein
MKVSQLIKSKFFAIAVISFLDVACVKAQMTSIEQSDTVSTAAAEQRRVKFHGAGKQKIAVTYDAKQLKDILETCIENGINDVQFVFATIRAEDTDKYINRLKKHGKNTDQVTSNNIKDKPTILLRVPRSAFNLALNEEPKNNSLVQKISASGPMVNTLEGNTQFASAYLYFDIGTICPPPDGCD